MINLCPTFTGGFIDLPETVRIRVHVWLSVRWLSGEVLLRFVSEAMRVFGVTP